MKKLILTLVVVFAFATTSVYGQAADQDKKPAIVFVENGNGDVFNGKIYASTVRGASRGGNGNSNDAFGNPGDWTVDLTVSEKSPQQAANDWGGFTESGHPCLLYTSPSPRDS